MGYWCRNSMEFILIGHHGNGTLSRYRTTRTFPQEISAPMPRPRRHSAKPLCARQLLGDYLAVGAHERLELFAREHADPRWDAWGLELPGYWMDAADADDVAAGVVVSPPPPPPPPLSPSPSADGSTPH